MNIALILLDGVDAMVFDIQDCGARFYTCVSALIYCMEAADENAVSMVVLGRPNPVNGEAVEGNIFEPGYESFIVLHLIPVRHGLTMGKLASFINRSIGCDLSVIEMTGWDRCMWFDDTGLPWVQSSPNLPTLDTATVYPVTCLFEGVNASEGRGATKPFKCLGALWIDGREWASILSALALPGVGFRACFFTPTFWRFRGENCGGVQVHVTDRDSFRPVETGGHLLRTLIKLCPGRFGFNEPTCERRHFDLLAGTDRLRLSLLEGVPVREITASWEPGLERFKDVRSSILLYGEGPG